MRILDRAECREMMVKAFAAGMRGEGLALGGEAVYCRRDAVARLQFEHLIPADG
jgi:hypothetical protein